MAFLICRMPVSLVLYKEKNNYLYKKIPYTKNIPAVNILVWDGQCGFCKYWKTRWEARTEGKIDFATYQEVAENFPDIPLKEFKKASRLIETDGQIYAGPDSAYRSIYHTGNKFWHELYQNSSLFRSLSDHGYNHIAKNRSFYFKITKLLLGSDPLNSRPYWLIYLVLFLLLIILL